MSIIPSEKEIPDKINCSHCEAGTSEFREPFENVCEGRVRETNSTICICISAIIYTDPQATKPQLSANFYLSYQTLKKLKFYFFVSS